MAPQRILVVDDDRSVTAFLSRSLSHEGYEVEVAHSGAQALDVAGDRHADLIVLDVMMPWMDGLEACQRLRSKDSTPILMLTAKDAVADKVEGLRIGADDYLVKPFAFEELLARIQALLRRHDRIACEFLRFADLGLDTGARTAHRGAREIELSTTEFKLLELFMRHPRQVLTRDQIMDHVWGFDFGGESNVLEVYVRYLRRKLEIGSEPRLIHTVRGAGYVLSG